MADKLSRTNLNLPPEMKAQVDAFFRQRPQALLKVPAIRDAITMARLKSISVDDMEIAEQVDEAALEDVLEYNTDMLRNIDDHRQTLQRPQLLVNALTSIYYIYSCRADLKVLCVGPRTESEFFMLLAEDFSPNNITGLDLISYSEYVDVGDMHAMPYDDDSFDIVFVGWVLTYSTDIQKVADECIRVAKPGGYVAIGVESPKVPEGGDVITIRSTDEIVKLFEGHVHAVPFRHDVHRTLEDTIDMVMAVIELK